MCQFARVRYLFLVVQLVMNEPIVTFHKRFQSQNENHLHFRLNRPVAKQPS